MGWPFQVHLLETLQGINGGVDSSAECIFVLIVSKLKHMAALAIMVGGGRPASQYG